MHPVRLQQCCRAALPQALSGEGRVHRLGRPHEPDRRLRGRRGQHGDALQLPRRRPREPTSASCAWTGSGAAARAGWPTSATTRSRTYVEQLRQLIDHLGRRPGDRCSARRSAAARRSSSPRAIRSMVSRLILNDIGPFIPQAPAPAPLADARAPLRVPRPGGPAAQDRRLAEERRADQRRHPLQRDLPPDQVVRRGRRARLPPRRARAAGLPRRRAGKPRPVEATGRKMRCPVLLIHGMMSDALLRADHQAHAARTQT